MAAPDFVPSRSKTPKYYQSPPQRAGGWRSERPGDLGPGQPHDAGMGRQGPDQGYALKLVKDFEDRVVLQPGERWSDAAAGGVIVALKRASIFGRAPIKADLEIAFTLWGFFDDVPAAELVELRRSAFDHVDNTAHHYLEGRRIADAVPDNSLRATVGQVRERHEADWRLALDLDVFSHPITH